MSENLLVSPFADAFKDTTKYGKKIQTSKYLNSGKIPVIDQGKDFISGYIEDKSLIYKGDLPVIIFGDHTRAIKFIDFEFAMGADGVKVLTPSKEYLPEFLYFYLKANPIESAGYSRHFKFLKEFKFPKFSLKKQEEIVKILLIADSIVDLHKQASIKTHNLISAVYADCFGDLSLNQNDYPIVQLSEVCSIARKSIKAGERSDLKYVGLENIESITGEYIEAVDEKVEVNSTTIYFNSEFILFSKLRPYLNKVFLPSFEGKGTSELVPLLPNERVKKDFLANFLRTKFVVDTLMSKNTGARMPRADIDVLMSLKFGLPPIQLQEKFSEVLNTIKNLQFLHEQRRGHAEKNFQSLCERLFIN